MEGGTQILDAQSMGRSITRMAHEILERNKGIDGVSIVGIRTRGATLANRIADKLLAIEGERPSVQALDTRPFRDDIREKSQEACLSNKLDVEGRTIILVDDVLYTGRTVRAGLDALMASGRATFVQLATLIDRGHRELPIRPDYVGKNVPTSRDEEIVVQFTEDDGQDGVWIARRANEMGR